MIRASALNEAELCGQVAVLARQHPRTYRNTLIGTAFHAVASGEPDAQAKVERLTPDERAELLEWQRPTDWTDDDE